MRNGVGAEKEKSIGFLIRKELQPQALQSRSTLTPTLSHEYAGEGAETGKLPLPLPLTPTPRLRERVGVRGDPPTGSASLPIKIGFLTLRNFANSAPLR